MPEIEVPIGGRTFRVACQDGEEHFLRAAAQMLDAEAQTLLTQLGRLPEARMLLMAGLMLADRTAAVDDELRVLRSRLADEEGKLPVTRTEAVIPPAIVETLAELAARAEAMAAMVEERAAG